MRAIVGLFAVLLAPPVLPACGHSVLVHRPKDAAVDEALTEMWSAEIRRVARDGDWLLVRSYAAAGDMIVTLTTGEEISHAAMYDASRDVVVEAITPVVREVTLEEFVHRNRYVIVVRPPGSDQDRAASLARARTKLGTAFDLRGMLGFDRPGNFYCSELVYWASGTAARDPGRQTIVVPNELLKFGEVVYFSGRRDDPQLARAAAGWVEDHQPTRVVSAARY
ncbi:MAG TPA: YiiX/YebB-like N1pC/P60 family cysteine hydrolase [Kofleriaceae bacterium]|jgi:hypothetical protein|nr:YiiX/YebB-like N1pC/P60 family cysteine hydrolase [Kofleriaceae bacterium]